MGELRLDEDRERPVVDQRHLHHRPELAGFHVQTPASQVGNNRVDEGLGLLPGGSVSPRRAAPLAGVAVQGELRDHENRGTHVERGTFVVEDAQLGDLAGNRGHLLGTIASLDAQEDDEALARPTDPLSQGGRFDRFTGALRMPVGGIWSGCARRADRCGVTGPCLGPGLTRRTSPGGGVAGRPAPREEA